MAFTRNGASAPTTSAPASAPVQGTTARMAAMQQRAAQSTALQAASPSVPVEITAADGQHFTVSFADVRNFICAKATGAECKIFLETCKQYRLNPFTKEAYLIHYDNNSEDTPSTIVLGKNCYMQMAERHPAFDGFEAGIIVLDTEAGQLDHREGSIVYEGEELLGGWAKVYRKDRTRPSYEEVKLAEYDTGKSLWKGKKATMIRKVALVHALREAFPSTFGTLYDESEVPVRVDAEGTARELDDAAPSPRWTRIRDTAAQADALAVEDADEPADDPFAGGGTLAKDPEIRNAGQKQVLKFDIKVHSVKNAAGNWEGLYVQVNVWHGLEQWDGMLQKGDYVTVYARELKSREYNGKTYYNVDADDLQPGGLVTFRWMQTLADMMATPAVPEMTPTEEATPFDPPPAPTPVQTTLQTSLQGGQMYPGEHLADYATRSAAAPAADLPADDALIEDTDDLPF